MIDGLNMSNVVLKTYVDHAEEQNQAGTVALAFYERARPGLRGDGF